MGQVTIINNASDYFTIRDSFTGLTTNKVETGVPLHLKAEIKGSIAPANKPRVSFPYFQYSDSQWNQHKFNSNIGNLCNWGTTAWFWSGVILPDYVTQIEFLLGEVPPTGTAPAASTTYPMYNDVEHLQCSIGWEHSPFDTGTGRINENQTWDEPSETMGGEPFDFVPHYMIILKPEPGYVWDTAPSMKFLCSTTGNVWQDIPQSCFHLQEDGLTYWVYGNPMDSTGNRFRGLRLLGSTKAAAPSKKTLTAAITNGTCVPANGTQFDIGTDVAITVQASSGYQFDTAPTVKVGTGTATPMTADPAGQKQTFKHTVANASEDIAVAGTATAIPTPGNHVFHSAIVNGTCNIPDGSEHADGTELNIRVEASSGYRFDTPPTVSIGGGDPVPMTDSTEQKIVFTYHVASMEADVMVAGTAVEIPAQQYPLRWGNMVHATCSLPDGHMFDRGENVQFTISAEEGYIFLASTPEVRFPDWTPPPHTLTRVSETEYRVDIQGVNGAVSISAVAQPDTPITRIFGIVSVFKPSIQNIADVCAQRFEREWNYESQSFIHDFGEYIVSIFRTFLDVAATTESTIALGPKDTNIAAPLVSELKTHVQMGEFTVSGLNGNALDYNAALTLYIPFIGDIHLDPAIYMNRTFSVELDMNNVTGDLMATIVCGNHVERHQGACRMDIPYILDKRWTGGFSGGLESLVDMTPTLTEVFPTQSGSLPESATDNRAGLVSSLPSGRYRAESVEFGTSPGDTLDLTDFEELERLLTTEFEI